MEKTSTRMTLRQATENAHKERAKAFSDMWFWMTGRR